VCWGARAQSGARLASAWCGRVGSTQEGYAKNVTRAPKGSSPGQRRIFIAFLFVIGDVFSYFLWGGRLCVVLVVLVLVV